VRDDRLDVDPKAWTPQHWMVIRDAAQEPAVQRIFVNAAIKKRYAAKPRAIAAGSPGAPVVGHDYHFHIRMRCPDGDKECKGQSDQGATTAASRRDGLLVQGLPSFIPSRSRRNRHRTDRRHQAVGDARGVQGGADAADSKP